MLRKAPLHITLTLSVLVCLAAAHPARAGAVHVTKVYTGSTVKLSDGRKIRLVGISAPDKKNKTFYRQCRLALRDLVLNRDVTILPAPPAPGRKDKKIPAYLFLETTLVNAELIRQGHGLAGRMPDNFRYRELFQTLQQEARSHSRGLWAFEDNLSEPYYVGSKQQRKFHRPGCFHVKSLIFDDRIVFRTKEQALAAGYLQDWRCCPLFRLPENEKEAGAPPPAGPAL